MLVRTRPFNPVFDRQFDRVFDQLSNLAPSRHTPVVDAAWIDGALVLTADMPGTPAEAVDVAVSGRVLTVSVSTEEQPWSRSVRLGQALDADKVSARYADGRLTVTVGAVQAAEPRRIEISTERPAEAIEVAGDDQPESGTSDNG